MRLVRDIILFIVALYIGVVLFMPKSQLYYFAEKQLKQYGVIIGNEELNSKLGSLEILHPVAYYQGADIARASSIKVMPLLFINRVEADSVELLNIAKKFVDVDITKLKLNESILKPYRVKIDATGNFGVANGYADLKSRIVHIDIIEPKDIGSIKKYLKKGEKGWFYESKF